MSPQDQLVEAVYKSDADAVQQILAQNPNLDINSNDYEGDPLLHLAALVDFEFANPDIVRAVLAHPRVDVNARDRHGRTALFQAESLEVIDILLDAGIDVNAKNNNGKTALELALANESTEKAKRLMKPKPRNVPRNATNTITTNAIADGNVMVNFHDEYSQGRYYKAETYNAIRPIEGKKLNPYTRQEIRDGNAVWYKAKLSGGAKLGARKKTRRQRKVGTRAKRRAGTRRVL